MSGFLLDTHTWLWVQRGETIRLSAALVRDLEEQQRLGGVYVSAISILEIARLVADGRYLVATSVEDFVATGTADGGVQLLELSSSILIESTRLPGKIHRDPSDRLLCATARAFGLTLVTQDRGMLDYAKQGHLKVRKI